MLKQRGLGKLKRYIYALARRFTNDPLSKRAIIVQGAIAARQIRRLDRIHDFSDVEFSVFSQWGEDGIIQWLIDKIPSMPNTFIEFGVENYEEANTRFLLCNQNWRGMVIDGTMSNIQSIRSDDIFWRHDLSALCSFITAENINSLICEGGFQGDIGILSIDIDGNDYWVWKAIMTISPWIVIVEYNAVFGDLHSLTIPYDPMFERTKAHQSNLYFGASIQALCDLAKEKHYTFMGTNTAGNNAFFIRDDHAQRITACIENVTSRPSRFRESRDDRGQLTFLRSLSRSTPIEDCEVVNLSSGNVERFGRFNPAYSQEWLDIMAGTAALKRTL